MPEREKSSLVEKVVQSVLHRAVGGITQYVERVVKRILRLVGLALAGVVIALLGLGFLAVGVVKWFSILMPGWLAWAIVGIILLLLGLVLTLATFIGSRS